MLQSIKVASASDGLGTARQYPAELAGHNGLGGRERGCPTHRACVPGDTKGALDALNQSELESNPN